MLRRPEDPSRLAIKRRSHLADGESPRSGAIRKEVFHRRLREWYESTPEDIIGTASRFKGEPWIFIRDGSRMFNFHADTARDAVAEYLRLLDQFGDSIDWSPAMSERGKMTAVAYGREQVRHTSFYLYVSPSNSE
jgi:hypothetical protein